MKVELAPSRSALASPNPPAWTSWREAVKSFVVSPSERNFVSTISRDMPIPLSSHTSVRISGSHSTLKTPSWISPALTASRMASRLFWSASRVATTGTST